MKNWPLVALVAVGLAYVIGAQFLMYERRASQETVARAIQTVPPAPRPKPASRPVVHDRPLAFGGYPCLSNCADDEAGYAWAKQNRVADPDDCTGKTGAFIEGCRVYARQQTASSAGY